MLAHKFLEKGDAGDFVFQLAIQCTICHALCMQDTNEEVDPFSASIQQFFLSGHLALELGEAVWSPGSFHEALLPCRFFSSQSASVSFLASSP
jgi:hypothetical protein